MLLATMSRVSIVRDVVFGATVLDFGVEDYCVECYSVEGCGIGGYYEEKFYVKSVMNGIFRRIDRILLRDDRTM